MEFALNSDCYSPDVQYVMCGSYDGAVYVWNCRTEKLEKSLREHKYVCNSYSSIQLHISVSLIHCDVWLFDVFVTKGPVL